MKRIKRTEFLFEVIPNKGWKCLKCDKIMDDVDSIQRHHEIHERDDK